MMKKNVFSFFLVFLLCSGMSTIKIKAQCAPASQIEKITPTINFFDFNGAAADGFVTITSITPATQGLGWTGSGTGSVFATSSSTQFNAENNTQTMSRPIVNGNPGGFGAVVAITIRPSDGLNGVGTFAGSRAAFFEIIYDGVTYATFATALGTTTNATITTANGATSSHTTIPANGVFTTVTFTLPAGIANSGTFSVRFTTPGSVNVGDDFSVRNISFRACSVCYKPSVTSGTILDTQHGITSLGRAGAGSGSGNWPMVRKGAWTALEAKTKGFVPNRMTTTQKNALLPVEGMMVYDTDLDCLSIYDGTSWQCFNTQTCSDL